jgi:hypothetical protein
MRKDQLLGVQHQPLGSGATVEAVADDGVAESSEVNP